MNYIKKIMYLFPLIFACMACGGGQTSDEYKALKAQNDSLLLSKSELEKEVNDYLSAINTIQKNMETIKQTENDIYIQPVTEFSTEDDIAKLNNDMVFLSDLLKQNKTELDRLNSKLRKSSLKINELEKTIAKLSVALETESKKVAELSAELKNKNVQIEELGQTVAGQKDDIARLEAEREMDKAELKAKDNALHTAWYVFGTRKELKEQNIINTKGVFSSKNLLESDFNKDYFIKIDARNTHSIPLYSSRAKILTTHPASAYTLVKENDNFVLSILDTEAFWSISKYLVIEVD